MRIVIVAEVFLPKVDGVVIRTMNLIRHLQERGDEILVLCPQVENRKDSPVPLVEFRSFPFPAYPEYRIGIPDQRLIEAIEDFAPDVLHFLNPFAFCFRCYDYIKNKSNLDIPSVFSFHTLYGEYVKQYAFMKPLSALLWWLMRDYHNCADANLTVSQIMKNELSERGFDRVHLWPPAVDTSLFTPDRASAEMRNRLSEGHPDQPLFITVSRLAPEKNVSFLAKMMQRVPEARLAVIGDGPQRQELEKQFENTNTKFLGYMKGEELATAYASSDAFVYASETETLGNVVLEAMASGLCVVAPRSGGIPSLVTHEENGFLFTPSDLDEAVSYIQNLLADKHLLAQLGNAACQFTSGKSWEKSADTVRQHYQNTIDQHQSDEEYSQDRQRYLAPLAISSLVFAYRAMSWTQRPFSLRSRNEVSSLKQLQA